MMDTQALALPCGLQDTMMTRWQSLQTQVTLNNQCELVT